MQVSETSSASNSGTTSTTGPAAGKPTEAKGEDAKKQAGATEADYLAKQAEAAQLAMAKTWDELKHSLMGAGDVTQWAKQYPWIATGAALAAGVAAGYLITPRDKDEFKEMWEKLKDKLHPQVDKDAVYVEANGKPAQVKQEPGFLQTFIREALKGAVPMVTSMLGGAMGSGQAAQEQAEQHGAS